MSSIQYLNCYHYLSPDLLSVNIVIIVVIVKMLLIF